MRQLTRRVTREMGLALHTRLISGDPTASADLAEAFLGPVIGRLRVQFSNLDDAPIHDAAVDAVLTYAEHPSRFNPSRASLLSYLFMDARGNLLNAMKAEASKSRRQVWFEGVELTVPDRNDLLERVEERLSALASSPVPMSTLEAAVEAAFSEETDRQLLSLVLDGERETSLYSKVLGISDQPVDQQRRTVKKHKDRITKRLQRIGERLSGR